MKNLIMSIAYFLSAALATLLLKPLCPLTAAHKQNKNCPKRCGDVMIEYPFGIGSSCSYDGNYTIFCDESTTKPKLSITGLNVELLEISHWPYEADIIVMMPAYYNSCAAVTDRTSNETVWNSLDLTGTPFKFDTSYNIFATIGCSGMATLYNETGGMIAACSSSCDAIAVGCNGYLCCQSPTIGFYSYYQNNYSIRISTAPDSCRLAFLSTNAFVDSINATNRSSIPRSLLVPIRLSYVDHLHTNKLAGVMDSIAYFLLYVGPALGALLLSCCCFGSCWYCRTKKRRMEIRLRAKYFKGRLEESSSDEMVEKTKLFTISELKKSTGNFNGNRVLGEGGQGTVYKGILTNGKVIAAKRSKTFEEKEWKQFINEVILLSQVNHKNVVKLLGCCLETKLPLLVYEYVPNGTLRQHIDDSNKDSPLSWKMRVSIAAQVAGAIAYLHSYSSTPIYHRDIKSTNILLDDKFQAKVSDFGISKAIVANQTHMTTCVQGTFGYLDPEYFRSSRFSEKSDVYSFGVILVELLTSQQPIRVTDLDGEQSLVFYFMNSMNRGRLDEILDPIFPKETAIEDIVIMANLAKQCLKPRGIERPMMKEVAMELESLLKESSPKFLSLDIENCEIEPTLDMDRPHTCPDLSNQATDTEYNIDDELPLFGVDTM